MSPGQAPTAAFDQASHAALHPAARAAFEHALDAGWGDPQRLHHGARQARQALEMARQSVAASLGCRPDEVFFTPSGTHAAHSGLAGLLAGRSRVSNEALVSSVEHSSVLHALEHAGAQSTLLPVIQTAKLQVSALQELLNDRIALVAVQSANHEVGTLQPLDEVTRLCQAAGVPLFVDACVTAGWQTPEPGWDVLAASAHKWGGPAGVGVLAIRTGTRVRSLAPEDERGWGRSPGFENVPAIVAAAAALHAVRQDTEAEPRVRAMAQRLREDLPRLVSDCVVLGEPDERAPHIVTASMLYVDGEAMLTELDKHGIAASSGSSCTSSTLTPSHVLEAMGVLTHGNLRLSLGRTSTEAEVDHLLATLPGVIDTIRASLGAQGL